MKTVLVVDDEFDLLQTICATLELGGYEPKAAGNGREALAMVKADKPDLLLTDVMMPYMSGYDLVQAVRRLDGCAELPAMIMSSIDPALHPHGNWNAVLKKPFSLQALLKEVERLVGSGQSPDGGASG